MTFLMRVHTRRICKTVLYISNDQSAIITLSWSHSETRWNYSIFLPGSVIEGHQQDWFCRNNNWLWWPQVEDGGWKDEIIDRTDLPPTVCTDPHGHPPPPACSCSRTCILGLPSLVPNPMADGSQMWTLSRACPTYRQRAGNTFVCVHKGQS